MSNGPTSAEQLEDIWHIVAWTVWKISTTDPDLTFAEGHTPKDMIEKLYTDVIKAHAEQLLKDYAWMGGLAGEYAAKSSIDFKAFAAVMRSRGGIDAATWSQS